MANRADSYILLFVAEKIHSPSIFHHILDILVATTLSIQFETGNAFLFQKLNKNTMSRINYEIIIEFIFSFNYNILKRLNFYKIYIITNYYILFDSKLYL